MAVYTVVSMKQDLERLLHSYQHLSSTYLPKTKVPCLSLMDLLLKASPGESDDLAMITQFLNQARQLVHVASNNLHLDNKDFEIFCELFLSKNKPWINSVDSISENNMFIRCDKAILLDYLLEDSSRTIYDYETMIMGLIHSGDVVTESSIHQNFSCSTIPEEKFLILIKCILGEDKVLNLLITYNSTLEKLQVLYNNVCLMNSMLKDSSAESYDREVMIQFQNRIADVADEVAIILDLVEYKKVFLLKFDWDSKEHINKRKRTADRKFYMEKLHKVTQEVACINEELKKIHHERGVLDIAVTPMSETGNSSTLLSPSRRSPNKDVKLVGLEKDLEAMLDCLTGVSSKLQVFPVIGMGGIGKTTFSRKLYDHPLVVHHFYIRAWVTVSQEYQLKEVLLGLLSCIANLCGEIYERSSEQLTEQMYRSLKGKRYIIILDDVWDNQVWDDLKRAFPDDKNGSRIMLTSRIRDVAMRASPGILPHLLRCLSQEESWKLLCSKIFGNGSCPHELVPIGNQIAYKCQGLPLAIVVVGGLLSKMNATAKVWEEVAQNIGSFVMEDPQGCQSILALSYNHLPDPLKACFLYLGVFPEAYEISSKKLIRLWIAEGFVQPKQQKTLEEVAEDCLEDLVARNLVMVKRKRSNGRIKICGVHDFMRDLCLSECQKESFLHVIQRYGPRSVENALDIEKYYEEFLERGMHKLRRIAFHSNIRKFMRLGIVSFPFTRSFFCFQSLRPMDLKGCSGIYLKGLKVLDIMHVDLLFQPREIPLLADLRFLSLTIQSPIRKSAFFSLYKLQTCIVDCEWSGDLPLEFWYMTELRHLHLKRRSLLDEELLYPNSDSGLYLKRNSGNLQNGSRLYLQRNSELRVLGNLQSLSMLSPQSCTVEIFNSMCNLKKLGVHETEEDQYRGWFKNLVCLKQLEALKYVFSNPFASPCVKPERLPSWDVFPQKLTKLSLSGTSFPWEDMLKLSMLPKLEVLKLKNYAFSGAVWKLGESCFKSLKFLLIGSTNLQLWEADDSQFPSLEQLVLRHCRSLKEIPYGIGEAPVLEKIELHCCGDSAAASARQIQEEQQSLGNDLLTVYITERLQNFSFYA